MRTVKARLVPRARWTQATEPEADQVEVEVEEAGQGLEGAK